MTSIADVWVAGPQAVRRRCGRRAARHGQRSLRQSRCGDRNGERSHSVRDACGTVPPAGQPQSRHGVAAATQVACGRRPDRPGRRDVRDQADRAVAADRAVQPRRGQIGRRQGALGLRRQQPGTGLAAVRAARQRRQNQPVFQDEPAVAHRGVSDRTISAIAEAEWERINSGPRDQVLGRDGQYHELPKPKNPYAAKVFT